MHPKCLGIAKKALAYRERTFPSDEDGFVAKRVGPATVNQLYEIFSVRSSCGLVGPQGTIIEPHQYFGVPDIYERGEWEDQNPDLQVRMAFVRIKALGVLNKFAGVRCLSFSYPEVDRDHSLLSPCHAKNRTPTTPNAGITRFVAYRGH